MEIIITEKGKSKGRISVARTLATMKKREKWETTTRDVDPDYVRIACTRLSRTLGREFSVSHTLAMGESITIQRIA